MSSRPSRPAPAEAEDAAAREGVRPMTRERSNALKLLTAGEIGGHVAAALVVAGFWIARGMASGLSAAVAAVLAIVFYTIGQAVQVRMADASPERVLLAAMLSYGIRVGSLAGLLGIALANKERLAGLDPHALVGGVLAVVVGWLAAEIRTFNRLEIPVYDTPSAKRGTLGATNPQPLLESEPLGDRQGSADR